MVVRRPAKLKGGLMRTGYPPKVGGLAYRNSLRIIAGLKCVGSSSSEHASTADAGPSFRAAGVPSKRGRKGLRGWATGYGYF